MRKQTRDRRGRFSHPSNLPFGVYVDDKGYLRISKGPLRGKRVHTLVAEAMLKRGLKPDEDVHHIDGDKLNCHWSNLQVMGRKDHGAVSAKQSWYFKEHDIHTEQEWNDYFDNEDRKEASFSPEEFSN